MCHIFGWAVTGGSDSPERLDFWSEPELALNEGRRQLQKETRTTKDPVLTRVIYTENDDQEGRRGWHHSTSFPFSPSLLIREQKVESVGRMCAHQEVKHKQYGVSLCGLPTVW